MVSEVRLAVLLFPRRLCRAMTAFVSNTDDALVSPLSLPPSAFIGVHQRLKLRSSRRSLFR
jgi:hypothetical protein